MSALVTKGLGSFNMNYTLLKVLTLLHKKMLVVFPSEALIILALRL